MTQKSDISKPKSNDESARREARLKAALKANLGRRKAQAKARSVEQDDVEPSKDMNAGAGNKEK